MHRLVLTHQFGIVDGIGAVAIGGSMSGCWHRHGVELVSDGFTLCGVINDIGVLCLLWRGSA